MSNRHIALQYLEHLENGDMDQVTKLFASNGKVDSPLYGICPAASFYNTLNDDTTDSKLEYKGLFEDASTQNIALYFAYKWTLKSGQKVEFDVVDIIEFDSNNKIEYLKIIYDTVISRELLAKLRE